MKDDRKTTKRGSTDPAHPKPRSASSRAKTKAVASERDKVAQNVGPDEKARRGRPKAAAAGRGRTAAKRVPEPFEVAAAATVAGMTPIEPPESLEAATPAPAARPSAPVEFAKVAAPVAAQGLKAAVTPMATMLESGAEQARQAYTHAQVAGDSLRQAMTESAAATTRGAIEINGKVLDLVRAQGDAALALWRSALTAGSLSEAVRLQSSAAREAYETTAAHWKDLAETTSRWLGDMAKPLQSTWTSAAR